MSQLRFATPSRKLIYWRRGLYFGLVIVTAFFALALLTSSFLPQGISPLELVLLVLYVLLILWISMSFWMAALGFVRLLSRGDRPDARSAAMPYRSRSPDEPATTALVMPIYNENPARVFAGLRSIYQSLEETGRLNEFDLFILSDTRDPEIWLEEERRWYRLCCDLGAHGRVFYRNREHNVRRKSGNLEDFLTRWGGRYRYMVVLDADSVMSGTTLTRMADLMEANPTVALIQSPPLAVGHHSLFARILQFASKLYGDLFVAGASFWHLSDSTYWGHNAIIRIEPFVKHCGLPKLPGKEPFGGEILSHDFVEAALLREAGWEVWLAHDLKGSYEELPTTLIDYVKRDRRWCQGNMQHVRLLFAKNFGKISRLHFLMGIMSYLSSPLWLLFLVVTGIETYIQSQTVPVYFFGENLFPVWPVSYTVERMTVLLVTLAMLFLPKILGIVWLFTQRRAAKEFGGVIRVTLSVVLETLYSALIAPVLMLYQSKFVLAILLRRSIGWPAQQRSDHRLRFSEALAAHWGQTAIGLGAGILSYYYIEDFFWWFTPVLSGLLLTIPLSMVSSSSLAGSSLRRLGLFLTPEEHSPPPILLALRANREKEQDAYSIVESVEDPAVFSLHLALLPHRLPKKRERLQLKALLYQLIEQGEGGLTQEEIRRLLSDANLSQRLHTLKWSELPR